MTPSWIRAGDADGDGAGPRRDPWAPAWPIESASAVRNPHATGLRNTATRKGTRTMSDKSILAHLGRACTRAGWVRAGPHRQRSAVRAVRSSLLDATSTAARAGSGTTRELIGLGGGSMYCDPMPTRPRYAATTKNAASMTILVGAERRCARTRTAAGCPSSGPRFFGISQVDHRPRRCPRDGAASKITGCKQMQLAPGPARSTRTYELILKTAATRARRAAKRIPTVPPSKQLSRCKLHVRTLRCKKKGGEFRKKHDFNSAHTPMRFPPRQVRNSQRMPT